ncbi:DUF2460 domain-containing protein [Methylocapsa sp. S129]|uniref:DUF2460 domain-containing protein n=1 Tax=Methylocapsa sp. S129 TaxID=1641869 RepID=UPI00131A65F2|nr:DUF2460 domain-containing protein [Methylocapsa sp. S129]
MTTPPSFPTLPGQGWSVHKKPTFSTIVASHVSGREVRDPLWQYPIWEFELTFDGLASDSASWPSLGAQSLQSLMGLFLQCQGQWGTFLYVDPTDSAVIDQGLGLGDGSTKTFTMAHTLGGFIEPVGWATALINVKVNGTLVSSGVSLATPNSLVFTTAPASGAIVTASFSYAFLCRFLDDSEDFEQFMQNLWAIKSVKFRSVRSN